MRSSSSAVGGSARARRSSLLTERCLFAAALRPASKPVHERDGLRLVRSLARRYRDMGLPLEDLVQEGAIGLLEAIDHFDAANGASFSTYAYWRARRTMTHALTDHGRVLHLPKSVLERRRAIADATADLLNAGRRPTAAALAEVTHLTVGDVVAAMEAPTTIASLDAPLDDGTTLEGTVADPAATEPSAAALAGLERAALAGAVRHLSPRQRAVVDARYGLSGEAQTLTEIGARLHVRPASARSRATHCTTWQWSSNRRSRIRKRL